MHGTVREIYRLLRNGTATIIALHNTLHNTIVPPAHTTIAITIAITITLTTPFNSCVGGAIHTGRVSRLW